MNSVSFSICSLIYIIIFLIVYFGKKRIDTIENKLYSKLLITTTIGLIIDIYGYISFKIVEPNSPINLAIAKIYLMYYLTWAFLLTIYTFVISFKENAKKNYTKNLMILYASMIFIITIFPVYIETTRENLYSYGPSVNFVYIISGICVLFMMACLGIKRKEINQKKYIPLFVLVIFGGLVAVIQKIYPDLLLLTTSESIITALMYFTIENPDMQMVEELSKNKKLTEQNFEEKSKFLFKISQDLKQPLLEIAEISNEICDNTNEEIQRQAKKINNSSKQLYTYVNNALDVSNMDIKNLKIISTVYNTKSFFEEIKLRINTELKNQNKNIEFRYETSENIPEHLYGDNTKLKQVILSIMLDAINHTNKGFIELNINSIVKYGICRLIIEISDCGGGMGIEKINNILSVTENITPEETEKIDKLNINLPLAHKIIKTLNGNLIIKSEEKQGTNFIIIIDQKIKENEIRKNELENYSSQIVNNKKILIVTLDKNIIKKIQKQYDEISVISSLYGRDCIEKIKNNEKYKCILIDDELKDESGIDVLKQIKKIDEKIPVIVLLKESKKFISEHYIEDGFNEFIIKEKLDDQLKNINKYL